MTHGAIGAHLLVAAMLLGGCQDAKLAKAEVGAELAPGTLRVDVTPPADVGDARALTQSLFVAPDAFEQARLTMYPTLTWSGTVAAEVAAEWHGVREVPTEILPVEATLSLTFNPALGERAGGTSTRSSASDGTWTLPAADDPALGWLDVQPVDARVSPSRIDVAYLPSPTDLVLPMGIPVWGSVHDRAGQPVAGVGLRIARDSELPEDAALPEGARFSTDPTGWFFARVPEAGSYVLHVEGGALPGGARILPTLATPFLVDAVEGAEVDVDVGELGRVVASCSVVDADGAAVRGAIATFESLSLAGSAGTLTVQAEADAAGDIFAALAPGRWRATLHAPYDRLASPVTLPEFVAEAGGEAPLGAVALGPAEILGGTVFAPNGTPAAGTLVVAEQLAQEGWVWTQTAGPDGAWAIELPAGGYRVSFLPPASIPAALQARELRTGDPTETTLQTGVPFNGRLVLGDDAVPWALLDIRDAATGTLVGRATTDAAGDFSVRVHVLDEER